MKKSTLRYTIIFIIIGAVIGSIIGIFGNFRIISANESFSDFVIKICIGLIVMIIDFLLLWAFIKSIVSRYIEKDGVSIAGTVEDVQTIPYPGQTGMDEWSGKVRYVCKISYVVDGKKYRKEFPPSCLTSKQELYPFVVQTGNEMPLKYLKKIPLFSIIDADGLKATKKNSEAWLFAIIPLVITMGYVYWFYF